MQTCVIVGAQWGDEGKAKVIDYLSGDADIVIRFQGGANAGHTVVINDQKIVFHMVPSGIMYPGKICVIGNGVVFDAEQFISEIDDLQKRGILLTDRLFVSDRAHMVLPFHKLIDQALESFIKGNKIGTTGRGIGPCYADKALRIGVRTGDLADWELFTSKLAFAYDHARQIVENVYRFPFSLTLEEVVERYRVVRQRILGYLVDTEQYLFDSLQNKKRLLFEGAQGTFLDIDHGTYPYVTSSNTIAGAACVGTGISPVLIREVVGITKVYTTRVGNGPFPAEIEGGVGEFLRTKGGEFGATTGRPRRCGWFDSVMVRKSIQVNGFTRLALTKLDVLNQLDEIKMCIRYEVNGKTVESFPSQLGDVEKSVPIYESFPGWKSDISQCKRFEDLPANAQAYIRAIRKYCYEVPVLLVSVGPERSQTIIVESLK